MDVACKINVEQHVLSFNFPAGTSRGVMRCKKLWIIEYIRDGRVGRGECSILEGLSPEYADDASYETTLLEYTRSIQKRCTNPVDSLRKLLEWFPQLSQQPSIRCGIEMALSDWICPIEEVVFDTDFARGKSAIPINGLIWMGSIPWMEQQVEEKIAQGFQVLKFKIAALEWEKELEFLKRVRSRFSKEWLTIRLDANGGFREAEVVSQMRQLSALDIHSIEQPVNPSNLRMLKELSKLNVIPVALDESLIPCYSAEEKRKLLTDIKPQYLVLKPSLHGGFTGVREWISLAEEHGIAWWITSALESNIGLKAIAQFTATYPVKCVQGLGTGGLFTSNFPSNLRLNGPMLTHYFPEQGLISSHVE